MNPEENKKKDNSNNQRFTVTEFKPNHEDKPFLFLRKIFDIIVSPIGKVVLWFILLFCGIIMFNISTTENAPELREFSIKVKDETTCENDTLNKFILYVMLDPTSTSNLIDTISRNVEGILRLSMSYRNVESMAKDRYYVDDDTMTLYGKSFLLRLQDFESPDTAYYDLNDHVMRYYKNNTICIAKESPTHKLGLHYSLNDLSKYLLPSNDKNPFLMLYFHFDFKLDVLDLNPPLERDTVFPSNIYIETSPKFVDFENRRNPLNILSVWPTPDHVGPDGIIFSTKESIEGAIKNGIFISAENLTKKQISDRRVFFCTLLLGVIVSWFITLSISLVLQFHKFLHKPTVENDINS